MLKRLLCAGLALLAAASIAHAQTDYPSRPVRLIVPFAAGGPADVAGRLVANALGEKLGAAVVVDNRSGAGAVAGTDYVSKSPADGYTLLFATIAHTIGPGLFKTLPFDPVKSFAPIGAVGRAPLMLVVPTASKVNSTADLIKMMEAAPGKLSYGSSGYGSVDFLAGAWFESQAHVKGLHVPYRGAAPALQDLIAGRLDFMITTYTAVAPFVQGGQLRALGASSPERIAQMPNVPTLSQAGLTDFDISAWYALLAPAGTPAPVIAKINRALAATMAEPEVKKRFQDLGAQVDADTSSEHLRLFIGTEMQRWSKLLESTGVPKQ